MTELFQVHDPANAKGRPRLVFIHGLDGDVRKTWMAKPKDDTTLWPRWVGQDTGCSVWLLGYGAATSRWKADAMALSRQATAVLETLGSKRELLDGPLILVGHSLGGLVIKTAIQQGMGWNVDRHKQVVKNIKGIVFVGTPHFGSRLATIAAWAHFVRANPQVSDLRLDDANLEDLNRYFLVHSKELQFKTRIYTETQPVRLPSWLGGRILPGVTIVSPNSSQAHIPGEAGIPIEANHVAICKPNDRGALIHQSLVSFVQEIAADIQPLQKPSSAMTPLASERFEAKLPADIASTGVHLAFSEFGINLAGNTDQLVCASICLVTDAPERLRHQLEKMRTAIQNDPLVNVKAKQLSRGTSLIELTQIAGVRGVLLRELAVISFSCYLYYCKKEEFDRFTSEQKIQKFFITPLLHRLSKKGESFEQIHTRLQGMSDRIEKAVLLVQQTYHRTPETPKPGISKFSVLEELATVISAVSCRHLGNPCDADATELFESLRTRIRYAENAATGENHKRDVNPLP